MFFCLWGEGRREGRCAHFPGGRQGSEVPVRRPTLPVCVLALHPALTLPGASGRSQMDGPVCPPLNKDLFLPGHTRGLATSCSVSSSERPASLPWTHLGLLFAPTPVGHSQCGPVLQPPAPREEPVPASGTRGGCFCWFPGSQCAVCGPRRAPLPWQPFQISE